MEVIKSVSSMTGEAFRLALFIDGLDEFSADHAKLVEFIVSISQAEGVKICASSRPWNVFNDAFCRSPSLKVQELTKGDIVRYVKGHFEPLPAFVELQSSDPKEATVLLGEIASRADGVFLWVSIVVRSITAQLSDGARLKDLHATLNQLPRDIEHLFDAIKAQIKPEHVAQSGQYFLLLMECHRTPSSTVPTASTFLLAEEDEDSSFHRELKATRGVVPSASTIMRRRLHSRTMGMIESEPGIQFLHRTVAEWASRSKNLEDLIRDASSAGMSYNVSMEIVKARAAELICGAYQADSEQEHPQRTHLFWPTLGVCLHHATCAAGWPGTDTRLVRTLDRLASHLLPILQAKLGSNNRTGEEEQILQHPFACLAAAFCIVPYVMAKAQRPELCPALLRFVVLGRGARAGGRGSLEPTCGLVDRYIPKVYGTRLALIRHLLRSMPQSSDKWEALSRIIHDIVRIQASRSGGGRVSSKVFFEADVLAILRKEVGTATWLWRFIAEGPQQPERRGRSVFRILRREDSKNAQDEPFLVNLVEVYSQSDTEDEDLVRV